MLVKQKLKYIQTLGQKKFREQEGLFLAEGPKLVKELLEADPAAVKEVFALEEWINDNRSLLIKTAVTAITVQELERLSQLTTPNRVLAIVQQYDTGKIHPANNTLTLALDTIQDPGNLGTIIRIADWYGISQIICSPDSAECYNPKVVQSTMGSIARVKVHYTDLEEWLAVQEGVHIYAAALLGKDVTTMDKIKEGIIVIGKESKVISPAIEALEDTKINIPKKGNEESLNAAVATGIILSHLT